MKLVYEGKGRGFKGHPIKFAYHNISTCTSWKGCPSPAPLIQVQGQTMPSPLEFGKFCLEFQMLNKKAFLVSTSNWNGNASDDTLFPSAVEIVYEHYHLSPTLRWGYFCRLATINFKKTHIFWKTTSSQKGAMVMAHLFEFLLRIVLGITILP